MNHSKNLVRIKADKFKELLAYPYFFEWIDAHVSYGSPPATYDILQELKAFVEELNN